VLLHPVDLAQEGTGSAFFFLDRSSGRMVLSRNLRNLLGLERTGHEPTLDEMLPPLPKKERSSQAKRFEAALSDGTEFETKVVLTAGGEGRTCRITCRVRQLSESEVTHA
jgi:hypothetical protein